MLTLAAWLLLTAVGCHGAPPPLIIQSTPTHSSQPAAVSAMPPLLPTETAVAATALPTSQPPTATPHPLTPYTLAGLRSRIYASSPIVVRQVLAQTSDFTHSYIAYASDGLTISGMMHMPSGTGPFPVVILVHGFYPRDVYWSGAGTWQAAEELARHGYIAIAPDLRSWGESDSAASFFQMGLVVDVLNLVSAVATLPQANASRVGIWGHSMGGGIATKVLTVDDRVKTAVLYAPNSPDDADLIARWGPGCLPGKADIGCNPSDILPPDLSPTLLQSYLDATTDPAMLQQIAPIYHLDQISAPIQIHIGTADGASLAQTPPAWSEKLYEGLRAANRPVDYYVYPEQGHFFQGEAWTLFMQRTVEFFDAHLQ